jgi:hypothetical protein
MSRIDWSKVLDVDRAARNLRVEMGPNDWYQDPWGWPELDFLRRTRADLVYQNCDAKGSLESAQIDVPKENWGTRPAVILDLCDRLTYQALIDRLSMDLIGALSPNVFGWRLPEISPKRGVYSRNDKQWEEYRRHLQSLTTSFDVALKTDLVSFFASIPIHPLQDRIDGLAPKGMITGRLCNILEGFDATRDRPGLPQRSFASAALANMYLTPLDDVLSHYSSPSLPRPVPSKVRRLSWARWMDDIWLFGDDPAAGRQAQMDLQSVARDIGLHLNDAKTAVLEGAEVGEQALAIEHSAVDSAIRRSGDFVPLEQLVNRLLSEREKASRSSVRFAAKRMRDAHYLYKISEILYLAPRMPHVADSLSRLFKESFWPGDLQDWYLEYVESGWATHQWSIAHFGRMFSSNRRPRKQLRDYFAHTIRDANTSVPLLAVATQRLCAWDPAEGRSACRDAIKRAPTAHARRVLSLSALGVGESRATVRKWLAADKENYPTLKMLESCSFTAPRVQSDFAG